MDPTRTGSETTPIGSEQLAVSLTSVLHPKNKIQPTNGRESLEVILVANYKNAKLLFYSLLCFAVLRVCKVLNNELLLMTNSRALAIELFYLFWQCLGTWRLVEVNSLSSRGESRFLASFEPRTPSPDRSFSCWLTYPACCIFLLARFEGHH